jgi:hypothetical protein
MLGGDGDIGDAEQRVGACREDLEHRLAILVAFVQGEVDLDAEALADPVALHGLHPLGPAGQVVEFAQEFFRIGGDAEEIHGDVAFLDQGTGAPAAAVDDLFVGEHRVVDRVPVHRGHLFIDQAFFEQAGEQPLLPAVVVRLAGGQFA